MHARHGLFTLITAMIAVVSSLPGLSAQEPPASNLKKQLADLFAAPPAPKVGFVLKDRHGQAMPSRTHTARAGGGNIDVAQPREDTLIITMTGVVTAAPQPTKASAGVMEFDLNQEFVIGFADAKLTKAKLSAEMQIIGLLRGDQHGGSAAVSDGAAVIACHGVIVLSQSIEGHSVCGEENLAINNHKGPVSVVLPAGDYHLRQTFRINAAHVRSFRGKAAAAEFGPDPALDPTWISVTDPFHGANKKEFGFRVTLRVEPE